MSLIVGGEEHRVYLTLGLVLGDNLGLNSILDFTSSNASKYYCRFCKVPKEEAEYLHREH